MLHGPHSLPDILGPGATVPQPINADNVTIPDGLYSGSKMATANDSNLTGGNIVTGASIFGVAGTQPPSQPVKTGQTTAYGTGSDADVYGARR